MSRNSCAAGFKALWHKQTGYPSPDFFKSLDPRLEQVVKQKFLDEVDQTGSRAGLVTPAAAELTGLQAGTAVAVGHVDAHVAMPAVGITTPGQMLMIMGTSTCHLLLAEQEQSVPGICGVVEDGIIPGLYGYEAGQNCVGDLFHWFVQHHVPEQYHAQAKKEGVSIHQVLRRQACKQKPGETGLLALDWWNGNRSVLVDSDLSGLIIGLNLSTRAADIYRALIESTAYGTRLIMDSLIKSGLPVESLLACGGIAGKDPMMMQIYADVTRRPIRISDQKQTVALGAAMYGAVAAGTKQGGYDTIIEAARTMPKLKPQVYQPEPEHARIYDQLYHEYCRLHDYFGRGINDVQKVLKAIRLQA